MPSTPFPFTPVSARQRDAILGLVRQHGFTSVTAVMRHLGVGRPAAQRFLTELAQGGVLTPQHGPGRARYVEADTTPDPFLVVDSHKPRILAALEVRPMLPSSLARVLGLPLDEVRETCRALQQEGLLVGTPVGASCVYARNPRLSCRVDPELARHAPQSSEARFRALLAALPPERPHGPRCQKHAALPDLKRPVTLERADPPPHRSGTPPACLKRVVGALRPDRSRGVTSLGWALGKTRMSRAERQALELAVREGLAWVDDLGMNYTRTPAGTAWLEELSADRVCRSHVNTSPF